MVQSLESVSVLQTVPNSDSLPGAPNSDSVSLTLFDAGVKKDPVGAVRFVDTLVMTLSLHCPLACKRLLRTLWTTTVIFLAQLLPAVLYLGSSKNRNSDQGPSES